MTDPEQAEGEQNSERAPSFPTDGGREYPSDDYSELKEVAEFDQIINERSDVYRCTCGFAFIALSPPSYCPGCGGDEFRA